ncbi:hypothetical protein Rhe02_47360 [Rhizocola hellebori]|uniref:Uncharacterized protein n=1 Tax=Rhizocola hellebori TaxID=1392758 RepID=A0A8J3VGS4_9ACTN|nr:hypothetical protein Rhe02_47360 [Rhizocola hellebori]
MPGFGCDPAGARIVPCSTTPSLPANDTSVAVTPDGAALEGDAGNPNVAIVMTTNSFLHCRIATLPSAGTAPATLADERPLAKGEHTWRARGAGTLSPPTGMRLTSRHGEKA